MLGYSALSWIGSFKRSSQVVFHISDLLFWAEYYRTTQDIGLLTIAVGQRRPVWISQTCIVQRQYLSQTSYGLELKTGIHLANSVLALVRNWRPAYTLRIQFWPRFGIEDRHTPCEFNSEPCFYFRGWQAQGRANQRRSPQFREKRTLEWPKIGPFIVKLSCDYHVISHKTFLILVTLFNFSCDCHMTDHKTFLFLVTPRGRLPMILIYNEFDWLI